MNGLWVDVLEQRLQRFNHAFQLVANHSPLYKTKYAHLRGHQFDCLESIQSIPLTSRAELLNGNSYLLTGTHPQGYFESSGTSGSVLHAYPDISFEKAQTFGSYLDLWMGLTSAKIESAAVALAYEMTPIGMRFQQALQSCGVMVIPTGLRSTVCSPQRTLEIICRAKPQAIFSRPLELLRYGDVLESEGKIKEIGVQKLFYLGETMSEQKWRRIEQVWGNADLYGHYGLTEVDTGLHTCLLKNYHEPLNPFVHFELLDKNRNQISSNTEAGEIIISTLHDAAAPLLRYQTGDLARRVKCACGSKAPAYQILGRKQDGVQFLKQTIFPYQIENIIFSIPEVGNEYQLLIEDGGDLSIRIEKAIHCSLSKAQLEEKVMQAIPHFLKQITSVEVYEWGAIANKLGIAKKKGAQFVDLRGTKVEDRSKELCINVIDFTF